MRTLEIITGHVIFKLRYYQIYQMKTTDSTYPSSCQFPLINYCNLDDDIDDHQTILARSLEELQHKLNRMEQELIIVGEESKELQLRLGQREDDLTKKVRFEGPYFNYVSFFAFFLTK